VGTKYGLYAANNITTLDVGVTSNADWRVVDLLSLRAPELHVVHAFNTAPGICFVQYDG
jgi:hypothetical protein